MLVYVFNFNLFKFSAAILEKGLLGILFIVSLISRATWFSSLKIINIHKEIHH